MNASVRQPRRLRRVLIVLAVLVFVAWAVLPSLALNIFFKYGLADTGFEARAASARVGLLLNSLSVEGLSVKWPGQGPGFSAAKLEIKGVSPWGLYAIYKDGLAAGPAKLADSARLSGAHLNIDRNEGLLNISLDDLELERLSLNAPDRPQPLGPIAFGLLRVVELHGAVKGRPLFDLAKFSAAGLTPTRLASLEMENAAYDDGADGLVVQLGRLDLSGLDLEAIMKLAGDGGAAAPLVARCLESLELLSLKLERFGRPALNVERVFFDQESEGDRISYQRQAEFFADPEALGLADAAETREACAALAPGGAEVNLELTASYDSAQKKLELEKGHVAVSGLGRLNVQGGFGNVMPMKADLSGPQILFSAAAWSLSSLTLDFKDDGLAGKLYPYLRKTAFHDSRLPSGGDDIFALFAPLFRTMEEDAVIANVPALESEAKVFLSRPESLRLTLKPAAPQPLMAWMANNKYDVVEHLNPTLQVNGRAPVSVAVAEGVNHDKLPSKSPQPMDSFFEEDLPN